LNDGCISSLNPAVEVVKVIEIVSSDRVLNPILLYASLRRKEITDFSEDIEILRLALVSLDIYQGRTVAVVLLPSYCYFAMDLKVNINTGTGGIVLYISTENGKVNRKSILIKYTFV